MLWPSATMRRTSAGFCSAQRPVIPNVAVTPAAFSVSRICPAYPASAPASNVRNTLRRAGDPRVTMTALPVTSRGRSGETATGPEAPAHAEEGVAAVGDGWTVDGGCGEGTDRLGTGEHADTTDAASQSTTTVRARIAIARQPVTTASGSSPLPAGGSRS